MVGRYAQSRAAARRRRRPPPSESTPKLWRPLLLSSSLAVQVWSPRMPLSNKSCVVCARRLNHIVPLVLVSMVAEEHCSGERGAVTKGATTARARIRFCPRNVFEHACAQGCSAHCFGRCTGASGVCGSDSRCTCTLTKLTRGPYLYGTACVRS